MRLYYCPGTCSLSVHIALREGGHEFDMTQVDLRAKKTEQGDDFFQVNPKGYVPVLELDDGSKLTECVSCLHYLGSPKETDHRLLDMLAFIATEIHKHYLGVFFPANDEARDLSRNKIIAKLDLLEKQMSGDYLFGSEFSAADAYLYNTMRWAKNAEITLPPKLAALRDRVEDRPAVQAALQAEGIE